MSLILNGSSGVSDVDGSASTPAIRGTDTNTGMFFPAADTIAFAEGGTEVARFDSSGRFGVGTTSPTGKLQVTGTGGVSGSSNLLYVDVTSSFGGISVNSTANNNSFVELLEAGTKVGGFNADTTNNVTSIQSAGGHALGFNYNNTTEAMRIDTSGNLLVNTTTANARLTVHAVSGAAPSYFRVFTNGDAGTFYANASGTIVGQVQVNSSSTAYVTSSDYRLKENIAPMTGALAKVAQLKPVTYTWKHDGSASQGFIAHELQEVVPECVSGEKDAVNEDGSIKPQGIDTSFLVATLTAAIQELKAELDTVKTELATLKGAA